MQLTKQRNSVSKGELFLEAFIRSNCQRNCPVLGAFAKLQKATISRVMSVCLSVRVEQICFTGGIKFGIWEFFKNLFRKFKFY
jgi:hypothetical protein